MLRNYGANGEWSLSRELLATSYGDDEIGYLMACIMRAGESATDWVLREDPDEKRRKIICLLLNGSLSPEYWEASMHGRSKRLESLPVVCESYIPHIYWFGASTEVRQSVNQNESI